LIKCDLSNQISKMGSSEKFCLRWNDFESNISNAFREIREEKDFFDVTLTCDDDQISAHKVILSACSPFFRSVLKRNKHEHPLLYLKGVKYSDLVAVLNFMYHGEVNVAQEDLNTFLAVAEDLKVKGLTQSSENSSRNGNNVSNNSSRSSHHQKSKPQRDPPSSDASMTPPVKKSRPNPPPPPPVNNLDTDDIQEVTPVKTEPVMAPPVMVQEESAAAAVEQYGTEMVDAADYGEDYGDYEAGYDGDSTYDGSLVDPNSINADGNKELWLEVKGLMVTTTDTSGFKLHTCAMCDFSVRNTSNLRSHIEAKHTSRRYACAHCKEEKRTWQGYLVHMRSVHGLRVKANQFKSALDNQTNCEY